MRWYFNGRAAYGDVLKTDEGSKMSSNKLCSLLPPDPSLSKVVNETGVNVQEILPYSYAFVVISHKLEYRIENISDLKERLNLDDTF